MEKIEFKIEERSIVFINGGQKIVIPLNLLKQKVGSSNDKNAYSLALVQVPQKPGATIDILYTIAAIIQKCYPEEPWDWGFHFGYLHIMFDVELKKNKFLKFKGKFKWPRFRSKAKSDYWDSEYNDWLVQNGLIKTDSEYVHKIENSIEEKIFNLAKSDFIDITSVMCLIKAA